MNGAAGMDVLPLVILGYLSGKALFAIGIGLMIASLAPGQIPWADRLLALANGIGVKPVMMTVAVLMLMVFVFPRVMRWIARRSTRGLSAEARQKHRRTRQFMRKAEKFVVPGLVVLGATSLVVPGPQLSMLSLVLGAAMAAWGMSMLLMSLRSRGGVRPVCGRCDYPMKTWRGSPPRCPECGQDWKDPWNARFGTRGPHWRTMLLGIAAMLISAAMLVIVRLRLGQML